MEETNKTNKLVYPKAGALSVLSIEKESLRLSLLAQFPVQQLTKTIGCNNPNV